MQKVFIISLLFIFSQGFSQQKSKTSIPNKPKLVVGIVIDQMRYDFLYRYDSKYSKGGFKRMMNEGFNAKNLHYHYGPTVTAAGHAAIFTGSAPNINGIVGNDWYDQKLNKTMYCVEDSTVKAVGNNSAAGKMSPKNLLVSTVTDQLRIANNFKSKTIGIALKDRGAILPAGHTANAAYWLDGSDGNWISSTFYMNELPKWVADYNAEKTVEKYRNQTWNTLLPIENYTESTDDEQFYESKLGGETKTSFPHEFLKTTGNINELVKSTPFGNDITKDFALAAIENEKLGMGNYTDFLTVSFSSPDYAGHAFGPNSIEVEDIYLKLDQNIAEILSKLDAKLGKNNYLVFLSADHGVADVPGFWKQNKMPAGVLAYGVAMNMANQAIKEKFGIEKLVESEDNSQLYLNDKIMKEKDLKLNEVFAIIKQTLMPVDAVADVINLQEMANVNLPTTLKNKIINGLNAKRSGDIMMLYKPMYINGRSTGTTHGSIYNYDTHVPALFFGWKVPKGESSLPYAISDIAPTISNLLNILEPSGNIGSPIIMK